MGDFCRPAQKCEAFFFAVNGRIGRLEHLRRAGIKSLNMVVMIGDRLNNQILELSQLASWIGMLPVLLRILHMIS